MDPDAAWATILDPASTHHERAEAALGLLAWLACDGFLPHDTGVGTAGVIEVCKTAVQIALDQQSSGKEQPMSTPYIRIMDLELRGIYLLDGEQLRLGAWDGEHFVGVVDHDDVAVEFSIERGGDGITKGEARAKRHIGTLPDSISINPLANRPLGNYLISLEREHGPDARGVDVHPR